MTELLRINIQPLRIKMHESALILPVGIPTLVIFLPSLVFLCRRAASRGRGIDFPGSGAWYPVLNAQFSVLKGIFTYYPVYSRKQVTRTTRATRKIFYFSVARVVRVGRFVSMTTTPQMGGSFRKIHAVRSKNMLKTGLQP